MHWEGQCISTCPTGTFLNGETCEYCTAPCATCTSATDCLSCVPWKFLLPNNSTQCVSMEECPDGTYPDRSWACKNCYSTCLTCMDGSSELCLSCNATKGLGKLTTAAGKCFPITCSSGEYSFIDSAANNITCKKCDSTCKTCAGPGNENCTACALGLNPVISNLTGKYVCMSCSTLNPGYTTGSDGKCKGIFNDDGFISIIITEICGDGKNLGQVECDDGNKVNGDGCSSECRVEQGFKCNRMESQPDYCVDIEPPQVMLSVSKGNVLVLKFTEEVTCLASRKLFRV